MKTFIEFMFWLQAFGIFAQVINISSSEYPRVERHGILYDFFLLAYIVAIFVWVARIKFGIIA